jgi:hypothetical protein
MRIHVPDVAALAAAPHLAALAALEAALAIAARAILAAVPEAHRGPFGCDAAEIIAARNLVDECDVLLALVADLRDQTFTRQRRDAAQVDWPF